MYFFNSNMVKIIDKKTKLKVNFNLLSFILSIQIY